MTPSFDALSRVQRVGLLAALFVSTLAIGGVAWSSQAPSIDRYDEIVHGDSTQLRKAAEALEEKGIPYRYTSNGNALEVPTSRREDAMVTAASMGLSGWQDILSTIDMGTPPSVAREYRTKALEAELMITLNSLAAIEGSRVHIRPLDRSGFVGCDKQASASVLLELATPGGLNQEQAEGVAELLAGVISGLSLQDVKIMSSDGERLYPWVSVPAD